MIYVAIVLIVIIVTFLLMVLLRKMQYDKTHINLLDLSDQIGGKVIRKSFANQPIYQGVYNNKVMQISFSKDKVGSEPVYYINFSMAISVGITLTITSLKWLKEMNEEDNVNRENTIQIDNFILRSSDSILLNKIANSDQIKSILNELEPFAYLLISSDGLLFDKQSTDILNDTKVDVMSKTIINLAELVKLSF